MNFVIHRERGRLKTCRTLSMPFRKFDVIDDPKDSLQIDTIHKHRPNNQSPPIQQVIPTRSCSFSPR